MRTDFPNVIVLALLANYSLHAADMQPIIITGGRLLQTPAENLAAVTVIERADIERLQAHSLLDLLRTVPGLAWSNTGGPGKSTSVFLRGTESDHVLVLLDGIKIGSATLGSVAWQDLPVAQIERIEIVRGPRSSLYGSEAIGGVIQIFTRKGGGDWTPSFSIGAGHYATYQGAAGLSGGGEHGWVDARISALDTAGFNACNGVLNQSGCFTNEPDRDGYHTVSSSLRGGYHFPSGAELDSHWLRTTNRVSFDGAFQNQSQALQQVFGASLKLSPRPDWDLTVKAGRDQEDARNYKDGRFNSRFDSLRELFSLQTDWRVIPGQVLSFGSDYQQERIGSDTLYAVTGRDNIGLFGQFIWQWGAHAVQFSLRDDNNHQSGNEMTGNLAWGYTLHPELRFTLAYGTAFKAPTFNELYFPYYGNPTLRPEHSNSVEAGLNGHSPWGDWALALYQTRITDLIAYDAQHQAAGNIDAARLRGIEASWNSQLGAWSLKTSLTLLQPLNLGSGSNRDKQLPRRAQESLRLDVDRSLGRWAVGATLQGVGRCYDDVANYQALAAYSILDLRGEYALAPDWYLQAQVENLLDAEYATAAFYNQPRRGLFLTLRYQP